MQRPQLPPDVFLRHLSDEDLLEVIEMGDLNYLCNTMTLDLAAFTYGTHQES